MSKICRSNCATDPRNPVMRRATFNNLYKWPDSDAEFMKSNTMHGGARRHSRVVDSISCRQMYLRSYTFSRKETVCERILKCFGNVKERVAAAATKEKIEVRRRCVVVRRLKEFSRTALSVIFRRLLYCTTTVDVADRGL